MYFFALKDLFRSFSLNVLHGSACVTADLEVAISFTTVMSEARIVFACFACNVLNCYIYNSYISFIPSC